MPARRPVDLPSQALHAIVDREEASEPLLKPARAAGCAETAEQGTALAVPEAATEPLLLKPAGAVGHVDEDPACGEETSSALLQPLQPYEDASAALGTGTTTIFIFGSVHFRFLDAFFGNT